MLSHIRSRPERFASIEAEPDFDLVIIGGGIHGATCAYLAAKAGWRTLLLEKGDFASGTSSRSSKMAHGGLRYLEMFDFEQVFEGIKAREVLFEHAPSLVRPARFLVPVPRGDWWFRVKLASGLSLYDLMVQKKGHKHRFVPRAQLTGTIYHPGRDDLMGCFEYTDGIMNDSRMVIEMVSAAARAGAICFNYAPVANLNMNSAQIVRWTDGLIGPQYEARYKAILNCAGPWAPSLIGLDPRSIVRFSQGTHLLFAKRWTDPPVFLPAGEKGRYYWVWPHVAGAMVGTTERELGEPGEDPLPMQDEVGELLGRLERDVPYAGLNRDSLHYGFAGIRTLPLRGGTGRRSSELSRKHVWRTDGKVISLIGGKYTTFHWTACEGIRRAAEMIGMRISEESLRFPELNVMSTTGSREIIETVKRAIDEEFAEKLDDIMRRRSDLELMPGHGMESLASIETELVKAWGAERSRIEIDGYVKKVTSTRSLLGLTSPWSSAS